MATTNGDADAQPHAAAAVQQDDLTIPLIDLTPLLSDSAPAVTREATAREILHGFQRAGFLYLYNHGVPAATVEHIFSLSAAFFARPQADKDSVSWYSPEANRGYTRMGREKVSQAQDRDSVAAQREEAGEDLKESLEIGRDDQGPGHENRWLPDADASGFRAAMLAFHARCRALHVLLMRALALALGIGEGWFDDYTRVGDNTLRLLHYPPVRRGVFRRNGAQVRAGAHSDYGSITLLFQDARGGLQVQSPRGTFVFAKPIPGTIVVNAGDLLARWSNDLIKSTIHRVVEPPDAPSDDDNYEHPARYSIAYFCNPDFHKWIDVIPNTVAASTGDASGLAAAKKYDGVNSGEYLVRRLTATY